MRNQEMISFERDRHHPPHTTGGRIIYRTAAKQKIATEPDFLLTAKRDRKAAQNLRQSPSSRM
jgi:hypothetical protein